MTILERFTHQHRSQSGGKSWNLDNHLSANSTGSPTMQTRLTHWPSCVAAHLIKTHLTRFTAACLCVLVRTTPCRLAGLVTSYPWGSEQKLSFRLIWDKIFCYRRNSKALDFVIKGWSLNSTKGAGSTRCHIAHPWTLHQAHWRGNRPFGKPRGERSVKLSEGETSPSAMRSQQVQEIDYSRISFRVEATSVDWSQLCASRLRLTLRKSPELVSVQRRRAASADSRDQCLHEGTKTWFSQSDCAWRTSHLLTLKQETAERDESERPDRGNLSLTTDPKSASSD